jgi:mycofactocin precursor
MGAIRHEEHSMSRSELSAAPQGEAEAVVDDLIETDSLVEEVSIDGMCGVY